MKRILAWLLVLVLAAGCMTGCAPTVPPPQTVPTTQPAGTTEPTQAIQPTESTAPTQPVAETPADLADTYWVGTVWYDVDSGERYEFEPESWSVDLLLRADGTARLRDIHEGISLADDMMLDMTWTLEQERLTLFCPKKQHEPLLSGRCENGGLTLDYFGLAITMEQQPLPRTAGTMYAPSEMTGTWILTFGETEGYVWEAMPAQLDSMVIRVDSFDGPLALAADLESRDRFGWMMESQYRQQMTVLEEPLYTGCANESWSVRIGEPSPVDANGLPLEPERYATLLDYDTMQVLTYYTLDGTLSVSSQTYWRFPSVVSWMSSEAMDLKLTNWTCTEYRDPTFEWGPVPEELETLELVLDSDGSCCLFPDGETLLVGTWSMGTGGVLLLDGGDDYWFGGAVSGYYVSTEDDSRAVYEMTLYYAEGLLRLRISGYG